jgi:Protein of unknown function (DUF3108)
VLLVHFALLSSSDRVWRVTSRPSPSSSMNTRTLEPAPTPPSAAPAPAQAPTPVAKAPSPAKKQGVKQAPAQSNVAQAAIDNVANVSSPAPLADPQPVPKTILEAPAEPPSPADNASSATTEKPSTDSLLPRDASRAVALQFPDSGKFGYNVTVLRGTQPQTGSGTLEWTTDGRQYQLSLESSALFVTLLSRTSVGTLSADGLMPERFSDKRFNRSEKAAHFQHDKGRITFSGNQSEAPLLRGAQDQLSVLMQLAGLFAGDPKQLTELGRISVQVANTDDAETWLFVVEGEEKLQLPAGDVRTVRLVRNPRKEFDTRLEVWLAPQMGYLPVRIKQTNANGNSEDLQLRSPAFR